MRSRRKTVTVVATESLADLLGTESTLLSSSQLQAVHKDCLLVDAALACDKLVASRDDQMREILRKLCVDIHSLRNLVWVNPTAGGESPLRWLESGARSEPGPFS